MFKKKHVVLCAALALGCEQAMAMEVGDIKWNGFLNAIYGVTNSKTLFDEHLNNDGSSADSHFSLVASAKLPEDWHAAMQLFARGGGAGNAAVDWAFATYEPSDSFALRIGKIKYPGALLSEILDVGYAHPWAHPPEEFYSEAAMGPNMTAEAFNGISPLFRSRSAGKQYVLQPYAGESSLDDGTAKKLIGVKASVSGDGFEALVNVSHSKLVLEKATSDRYVETNNKTSQRWNVGASYDRSNVLAMAEYGKSTIGSASDFDTTAGYVTLGYRFGKYLPSLTYSYFDQQSKLGETTVAAALRYEMNSFSALKVQWNRVAPNTRETALTSGAQPSGLFGEAPTEKSVNIFNIGLNVVF